MDCNLLSPQDLYVLTCTECHNAFPPSHFRGQHMEFRMCAKCKRNNPEIYQYLEKYIYRPQREGTWRPFQERLDELAVRCGLLEAELASYKCQESGVPIAGQLYESQLLLTAALAAAAAAAAASESEEISTDSDSSDDTDDSNDSDDSDDSDDSED